MNKEHPNRELTSNTRKARLNILAFVKKTGKIVFSFADADVNSITMRKLAGSGVIVLHGVESTATSEKKTYKLSKREMCRLNAVK